MWLKRNHLKIFSVLFALVLICSLGLVMAAPVAADPITSLEVTVTPPVVSAEAAYQVVFQVHNGLQQDTDTITVRFPAGVTVPAALAIFNNKISINTAGTQALVEGIVGHQDPTAVTVTGQEVMMWVPADIPAENWVMVEFGGGTPPWGNPTVSAGLMNPASPATDNLCVWTCEEDTEVCVDCPITIPPGPVDVYEKHLGEEPDCCLPYFVYLESFDTIQEAIDAAQPYDTIKLGSGIYELSSTLIIDKAITLLGINGTKLVNSTYMDRLVDVTYLSATSSPQDSVTIDGITFERLRPGVEIDYAIYNRSDYLTVQNCTFNYINWAPIYIISEAINIRHITIKNNTINNGGIYNSYAIAVSKTCLVSNVIIDGNTINNFNGNGIQIGIPGGQLTNTYDLNYVTITNNTITNCGGAGIVVWRYTQYVTITDNIISGSGLDGITISPNIKNVIIEKNTVTDSGSDGIQVAYTEEAGNFISFNDIYNNQDYGMNATGFPVNYPLDAKHNWWGEAGGPSSGTDLTVVTTALGNGDSISADVVYNPWLSVSYETVVDEGICYYGSDTLTLQAGWNTLSVPLALHTSYNTIAEIESLGDFLTGVNYSGLIYEYDPVSGWEAPTELVPGRGYYIKMISASRFPVLYSNQLSLTALELAAGWNLIGSAFGIDKLNEATWAVGVPKTDAEAEMGIGAALDPIGAQVSVVVSPSAPGQLEIWSVVYADDDTTTLMYTGEAYWVFMTSSGTLAGFEITPLRAPDLGAPQPWSDAAEPPRPGIMHVKAIEMSYELRPGTRYRVDTEVTIVDAYDNAVYGATVYVETTLPDGSTKYDYGDTDADGIVTFSQTGKLTGEFTSTVTNVVGGNWIYNSGANEETFETLVVP